MSTIKVRMLEISKEKDAIKTSGSKRQVEISVFFMFKLLKYYMEIYIIILVIDYEKMLELL